MRRGPTLTVALWDPARGSVDLREAATGAAATTRLPTTVEDGAEEGLVQVHVWAGSLGLGLPEDRPEGWADLGRSVGSLVRGVDPALALAAPEWGVDSLAAPDYEALRPGLCSGRARGSDLDEERVAAFAQLAERGVVHDDGTGWSWAASGAVALTGAATVAAERLAPAIFHAWWGRRPEEEPPGGPRLVIAGPGPDRRLAVAVAAALPTGYRTQPRSPDTVVATPPGWVDDRALLHDLAEAAVLVDARWAGIDAAGPATLHTVWLPHAPDDVPAEVVADEPPHAGGVLLRGPYARLVGLLGRDDTDLGRT